MTIPLLLAILNIMSAETSPHFPIETPISGTILVVDDHETNRDVLTRRLEKQGHAVQTAANGKEALELLEAGDFDAVLLDIMMPEMDGYETLRHVRAQDKWRYLPVIMISAVHEMEAVVRCIEMGADDYLPKPFSPTLLRARLNACLERKRAHDREQQLYAQLQENFARLKELEQMRDDLTHMIVHDLRSPLTATLAGIEMAPMAGPLSEPQQECLDIALRSGKNLLHMINNLLDISKLEAGALQLHVMLITVEPMVTAVLTEITPLARDKNLQLNYEVAPDLPPLPADEEKLRRILFNLLSNAIKFTSREGEIFLQARREGESIFFSVRDSGEGIPPESLNKVFDKFAQVENRRAGRKMSTGLGLTFCKMAVEAHGGRIWVESEVGKGSTFYFTLPVHP